MGVPGSSVVYARGVVGKLQVACLLEEDKSRLLQNVNITNKF